MIHSLFIGARTLSNDCNLSATAIFRRSAIDQIYHYQSSLACDAVATRVAEKKQSDQLGWCASTTEPQAGPESRFWWTDSI